jgi:hypothetical protein
MEISAKKLLNEAVRLEKKAAKYRKAAKIFEVTKKPKRKK